MYTLNALNNLTHLSIIFVNLKSSRPQAEAIPWFIACVRRTPDVRGHMGVGVVVGVYHMLALTPAVTHMLWIRFVNVL